MAYFVVSYDLRRDKDYSRIITRLEELGALKAQRSFWLLDLADPITAAEVREHLASFVDSDDWLMVVEFSQRPSWTKSGRGTQAWVDARF